ncbi:iron-sulfur cluster assembly protein CIA2 [Aspergillus tanneri]|uniref:MIP18 family-like domain-containing protein n=1 Tax=Aspergillus tanneri TaxID=1220188 RepID=A0A5M9M587_9EURO|nr:uncharacterized protein ATNIH1004_011126 [Aspergillus tanneri]KAA8642185.1 hypothetical protein ATNIH1004_011126 [Aspergillus tanneri]
MQNSNPTIINSADLPTRLHPAVLRKPSALGSTLSPTALFPCTDPNDLFSTGSVSSVAPENDCDLIKEPIDEQEIYDVSNSHLRTVTVLITPTITHCSLATVIGLGVRVRLEQSLPPRFRVDVRIKEGTHSTADEVNKQLADKERVAAALENGTLMGVIAKMLETCQ